MTERRSPSRSRPSWATASAPKFPLDLTDDELEGLISLATALRSYHPRPRWLRKLPIRSRLRRASQIGLLSRSEYQALQQLRSRIDIRWVFAHADINPSNIVATDHGLFLLDWEWAGLYPDGYDLAFLWFVLIDLPEARSTVEGRIRTDPTVFWLSALIIELLHLEWFRGEFRPLPRSHSRRSGRKAARPATERPLIPGRSKVPTHAPNAPTSTAVHLSSTRGSAMDLARRWRGSLR